jgi:serine/threonine-protein kinase
MSHTRLGADSNGAPDTEDVLEFGEFRFVVSSCRLYHGDFEVHLRPKAAAVLRCLLLRPGEVVTKEDFLDTVWRDVHVREESLTQAISTIRRRLGDVSQKPDFIETVPGVGYRFIGAGASVANGTAPTKAHALDEPAGKEPRAAAATTRPGAFRRRALLTVAAAIVGLAAGALAHHLVTMQPAAATRRFVGVPASVSLAVEPAASPLITVASPEASIVYRARDDDGHTRLFLKPQDRLEGIPVPGSEGALMPFASPDGEWVGFLSDRQLWKVPADGAASPLAMAEVGDTVSGVAWGSDAVLIIGRPDSGLERVFIPGGSPEPLTEPDHARGERSHEWPAMLPGSDAVLFNIHHVGDTGAAEIAVLELASGDLTILPVRGARPRYVATGHLVYGRAQSLVAVPFDLERREIVGSPVSVIDGLWVDAADGRAEFAIAADGTLVYATPPQIEYRLCLYRHAEPMQLVAPLTLPTTLTVPPQPRFSHDGGRLAYRTGAQPPQHGTRIQVYDLESGLSRALTSGAHRDAAPLWLPPRDERLLFSSNEPGTANLFTIPSDGGATAISLLESSQTQLATSVSADGTVVLYQQRSPGSGWDILALERNDNDDDDEPTILVQYPGTDAGAVLSPDGRYFAYTSDVSGMAQVYVRPYPDHSRWTSQVSTDGGHAPRWSPDGRELYFVQGDRLMAVTVRFEPEVEVEVPREIHRGDFDPGAPYLPASYDLSPDGDTFVLADATHTVPPSIRVVLNWFDELARLAPRDR